MTAAGHRREHDLLGDREIPADAYWGIHTLRAVENFPITGTPISTYPHLINALAAVKEAAARANEELCLLDSERADAIAAACREIGRRPPARPVRRRRHPGRRRNLDEHERQRGDRQPRAGDPRPHQGRLRPPAPQRARQPQPVDQRRLPHRGQTRHDLRRTRTARRDDHPARSLRGQGRGVPRRRQDGPHPAPGRGADDPRPGVRHLRGDDRTRTGAAWRRPPSSSTRSTSAPPPSAPVSTPPPATPKRRAHTWPRSPACPWSPPPTSSKPPRTAGPSSTCPASSSASPSSCPRSATTCACCPPAPARDSTRSTSPRCRPVRASCPARSTR